MEGMFLPILIALVVGLLVFVIWSVTKQAIDPEKRRLKERLSTEGPRSKGIRDAVSITVQTEATGLSGKLTALSMFDGLHKRVIQAYPDMSLVVFLCICGGLSSILFMIAFAVSGTMIVGA